MANNSYDFIKDAFAAPLGDFIASIGKGVGEAQAALDAGSLRQTLELYNGDPDNIDEVLQLLRQIGYQPTFYTIPKTTAKAKIALSISQKRNTIQPNNRQFLMTMYATPVNATTANTYNMDLNMSAEIQFDIVPVPPSELSLVRVMPQIIKEKTTVNGEEVIEYKSMPIVESLLNQYGIPFEIDAEALPENPIIKRVSLKDSIKELVPGKTVLTLNDVVLLEIQQEADE